MDGCTALQSHCSHTTFDIPLVHSRINLRDRIPILRSLWTVTVVRSSVGSKTTANVIIFVTPIHHVWNYRIETVQGLTLHLPLDTLNCYIGVWTLHGLWLCSCSSGLFTWEARANALCCSTSLGQICSLNQALSKVVDSILLGVLGEGLGEDLSEEV